VHGGPGATGSGGEFGAGGGKAETGGRPFRKSITPDYLVCLDDGKKFKSLRRGACQRF